ncbi:MAG: hypothetical protein IIV97_02165 [Oscillospiraceae bacterium]|nr:hypothetical protein [Oscillospiraceae bacterium]
MISCTEFIPLYSEFFNYLEEREGPSAVMDYWFHISDESLGDLTNPHSLASNCEKYGGFEGAKRYWGHTLTEEACDLISIRDENKRFAASHMRYCPSRGMLNAFEHIEPYHNYCEHCNVIYARVLEKYGVEYVRDTTEIEHAACRSCYYEKGNPPDIDWRHMTDEDYHSFDGQEGVTVADISREGKKYLHRDFHLSGDNALAYCGDKFGDDAVIGFLNTYVEHYYAPVIEKIKKEGLPALCEWIENLYTIEEAPEVLHTELSDKKLTVTIDKSPVIEYMRSLNQEPSKYYIEETRTLYKRIAELCAMKFDLEYYNEDGGTKFTFSL